VPSLWSRVARWCCRASQGHPRRSTGSCWWRWWGSRAWSWPATRRLRAAVRRAVVPLAPVVRSPRRLGQGFGGACLLSLALAGTLWAVTSALGTPVGITDALVVVLVGVGVGAAVPTPGGTGGVEVAMTGGLVAAGVPLEAAAPAVVLYRLLTLWLPVPLGLLAGWRLRALGAL
jgi:uncharacterized membrane protein YbhN (UPF0104 family)